jgi:C-terminal processing protease CtpA/Prc
MCILILLLPSCDEGGDGDCSVNYQNHTLYDIMQEYYLWYQEIDSGLDVSGFDSPEQLLDFLRYDQYDRFSYITDAAEFDSLYNEGQYLGYGFSYLKLDAEGRVWVRFIYDDSPAGRAGLQRGDEILSIDGRLVSDIIDADEWSGIFGPDEEGYPLELIVRKADDSTTTLNLQKAVVNVNTVLYHSVIDQGADRFGYLVFKSFLHTSDAELEQVFGEFKLAAVNKVIIDLRYNGGGSVSVARNLGSYLHGDFSAGDIFTRLEYNDKNPLASYSYQFIEMMDALQPEQVLVIATAETCSASEMVINGLEPFVDVRVIGGTTCGKPVGMNEFEFCGKAFLPVTFAASNHTGNGEYFDGLPADCPASDDLSVDFGQIEDPMLAEALFLSQNNQCLTQAATRPEVEVRQPEFSPGSLRAIIGAI